MVIVEGPNLIVDKLRKVKHVICKIQDIALKKKTGTTKIARTLKKKFDENMDNNLHVKNAFDKVYSILFSLNINELDSGDAASIIFILRKIDSVLDVIFS